MYTYTVTIGRGTGTRKLSDVQWAAFEDEVNDLLAAFVLGDDDMIEVHRGTGVWDSEVEESTKTTLLLEVDLGVHSMIRTDLRALARTYNQDAIALTIGESELITK